MVTKLLVTGAAGFMGSNFVRVALEAPEGYEITVLDALTYAGNLGNLDREMENIKFVQGSILDELVVNNLVAASDVIIHFAAESHNDRSLVDPQIFTRVNILGTEIIAAACLRHGKRLHHVSTDEIFGDLPIESEDSFTETSPIVPSSPYSASKAASDLLVLAWVRSFGLKATVSNSANNYGPNQFPEKLIPRTIELVSQGMKPQIYGKGLNVRDWLHVDDHSRAVLAIINGGQIGERYLVSAGQLRNNLQIAGAVLDAFGRDPQEIEFVGDRPGHDLKYSSDSTKLRSATGWSPRGEPIEEWLRSYITALKL